ncbi:MAG: HD-GYP domain-containing protein [Candidatus Hydrogenedens sp.]|nr:HD-GYP domain-containing protein [Candidatus Hydrogenedens sp.]
MNMFSPEIFGLALDNTVDSVVITDMNNVIQYANPAFTKITGFDRKEALGKTPSILRSRHTTLETYQKMWAIILSGGWWRGHIINVKANGEEWHSFLSISQVRDASGEPMGYVGIARDITEMKRLEAQLHDMSLEAIYMLAQAAEAKDEVTGNHLQRVRAYSEAMARHLGMSDAEVNKIGYSSILHDVGKLQVPDAILKKEGKLTEEEWEEMKKHPQGGAVILRDKDFYQTARDIAVNHHERWDGTGYPKGKKGEEIPLASRIVTVADVFDALTTSRPYKRAWSPEEAFEKICQDRGSAFDPEVVDAFAALYHQGTIGELLREYADE